MENFLECYYFDILNCFSCALSWFVDVDCFDYLNYDLFNSYFPKWSDLFFEFLDEPKLHQHSH